MSPPKLSICIPTYNRAKFLPVALDSIITQAPTDGSVEICISDNGSIDNTPEIVKQYKLKFPFIVSHRNEQNWGPDRCYLKTIEIASGDFCWLLGSDDIILENSIEKVLELLTANPSLSGVTLSYDVYDINLNKVPIAVNISNNLRNNVIFDSIEPIISNLLACFGLLSTMIVNRLRWNEVIATKANQIPNYYNAYVQMYVVLEMLSQDPVWAFVVQPYVGWRSGNDSFLSKGYLNRVRIDIYGYSAVLSGVFNKKSINYRNGLYVVIKKHIIPAIIAMKLRGSIKDTYLLFIDCFKVYRQFPIFWLKVVPMYLIPGWLYKCLYFFYRRVIKN